MANENGANWIRRLQKRLKDEIVQEVPDELAVCEFDCRKPDCRMGDWECCQRRRNLQN